jgi:hypothetical protein
MANPVTTYALTTAALAAGAAFTSNWYDNDNVGAVYVSIESFSDQGSNGSGVVVQETDDNTNTNLTRTVVTGTSQASTQFLLYAPIRRRFFRFIYTNSGTAQTTFELTATAFQATPLNVDSTGGLILSSQGAVQIAGNASMVEAADPLGSNDPAQERRLLELIWLELQTLNAYFANSGLLNTSVQAAETVQTTQ